MTTPMSTEANLLVDFTGHTPALSSAGDPGGALFVLENRDVIV